MDTETAGLISNHIPISGIELIAISYLEPEDKKNISEYAKTGFYEKCSKIDDVNAGLIYACNGGNTNIVQLMIERGANNWDYALSGACEYGHMDIVEHMIEKGATDWNWGLFYSCKGGHMAIVRLMIEKGATICWYCKIPVNEH